LTVRRPNRLTPTAVIIDRRPAGALGFRREDAVAFQQSAFLGGVECCQLDR
jgi:hypothetical protein